MRKPHSYRCALQKNKNTQATQLQVCAANETDTQGISECVNAVVCDERLNKTNNTRT